MNNIFKTLLDYPAVFLLTLSLLLFVLAWLLLYVKFKFPNLPLFNGVPYILALLVPLLWLLAPPIFARINTFGTNDWEMVLVTLGGTIAAWYILPLALFFLVFILFLNYGIEDSSYEEIFKPRKLVWGVFGLFILFLVWFLPYTLLSAGADFAGKHADLGDVVKAVNDLEWQAYSLNHSKQPRQENVTALVEQAKALDSALARLIILTEPITQTNKNTLTVASGTVFATTYDEVTQNNLHVVGRQMQIFVSDILTQVQQIHVESEISATQVISDPVITWRMEEIVDKSRALEAATAVFKFEFVTPFLMLALLFAVFLLIPWLLYISFIVSKREEIVDDRRELLEDLNQLARIRDGTLSSSDLTIQGANRAREVIESMTTPSKEEMEIYSNASLAYTKACQFVEKPPSGKIKEVQKAAIIRLADNEVIKSKTFHSREYLIPLLVLSFLTMVGWYYTIFPTATNGLVMLIEQGGSSVALTNLITAFTPFTMVFAGAWFFMVVMLTYRWVNNDLYPRSYFNATMRLVYGLLVGLVFVALFGTPVEPSIGQLAILTSAFFVGMVPLEFVRALGQYLKTANQEASGWLKYFTPPLWMSGQPLTALEDITIWDDTRFNEEGIQNIHALATADLARLALRTPYDAQKLVDWVDQALLHIHSKVLWQSGMNGLGIRTANDLFEACGIDDKGAPNMDKVKRVADAFNETQLMSIGTDDPRFVTYNAAADLEGAGQELAEQAEAVKEADEELDPAKPETLDTIVSLRIQVSGLQEKQRTATNARKRIHAALLAIAEADASPWAEEEELAEQLKKLTAESNGLLTPAKEALAETKLKREMLETDLNSTDGANKPGQTALKKAQDAVQALITPSDEAKKLLDAAMQTLNDTFADATADKMSKLKDTISALHEQVDTLIDKSTTAKEQGAALTKETASEAAATLGELQDAAKAADKVADELITALEAADTTFDMVKEKVTDLKTALGIDKVQKTIRAAKSKVETVKESGADIVEAQTAITTVVTEIGSADSTATDNTIAGKLNAVTAIEPVKKMFILTKAESAETKITALITAVEDANTLAQSIKNDDAATWDKVKALAKALDELKTKVEAVATKRDELEPKMDALSDQETLALRKARKMVKELVATDATTKAEAAVDAFKGLTADSAESKLKAAQKTVEPATTGAEALSTSTVSVAEEAMNTALPLRLTEAILHILLDTMDCDPNIHYIRHYWQAQRAKSISKQDKEKRDTSDGAGDKPAMAQRTIEKMNGDNTDKKGLIAGTPTARQRA